MKKKIGIATAVTIAIIIAVFASYDGTSTESEKEQESIPAVVETSSVDIVMPTKVSRPGCEQEDKCYLPSTITINVGESVSWLNDDSAFHSVTSGVYGSPTDLFDSGYMDPGDVFTYTFEESGEYVYYCTLHEWMYGVVLVT